MDQNNNINNIEALLLKTSTELMSLGGDTRITIDEKSGLNRYGCVPYPSYTIPYSSCTSNTISLSAFSFIESYLNMLRHEYSSSKDLKLFEKEYEKIRVKIKSFFQISGGANIFLGSSGTDLELVILALGLMGNQKNVHNIILGLNEVGSGTEFAASGQYFSTLTPLGKTSEVGKIIQGFDSRRISFSHIGIRCESGLERDEKDIQDDIIREIELALKQQQQPICHIIHRSKTGLIVPNFEFTINLKKMFGDRIDIVADACQGRISTKSLNKYLEAGISVLLTGSKFFSGPPFSGALIVPPSIIERVGIRETLYEGLSDFFTRPEFPLDWKIADNILGTSPNLGLLLRWMAAIYEMNKVFAIPKDRIRFVISTYYSEVSKMIEKSGFLKIVDLLNVKYAEVPDDEYELNSVITFTIQSNAYPFISYDDAQVIHRAMYSDLSQLFEGDEFIQKVPVLLGQPVKVLKTDGKWNACLRIALSSNLISEVAGLDDELVQMRFFSDMNIMRKKLNMVVENLDIIRNYFQ